MEFDSNFNDEHFDESVGVREILEKYLIHFKWFILSILVFGVLFFIKLHYEVPMYNVSASILIKEQQRGNSIANLTAFEDLGLFASGDNSLENEMQILKSRKLNSITVEELKLNIRYFIEDSPFDTEQFPNFPIILNFKSDSSTVKNISSKFEIIIISKDKFKFIDFDKNSYVVKLFKEDFSANLGNKERSDKRIINISLNNDFGEDLIGKKVKVKISSVNETIDSYIGRLEIEPVDEILSNVLKITMDNEVIPKGIAFINNLIEQYNADGIIDKNLIAQSTTNFLDERLLLISKELKAIETMAYQYKSNRGMVGVNAGASNIYLQSSSIAESETLVVNTQLTLVNYMLEELNKSNLTDPLPGNIGLSDPSIIDMIGKYNNLVLQRNRILKSSTTKNPLITNIDSQLNILKNNLKASFKTLRSSAQIQLDGLTRQRGQISSKISSVPKHEKELKEIVRQQETKNALYLFLLQKREESIISNAVSIEKAKIIDEAYSNGRKISPKKMTNYIGAIILGLLIPFLIIYIKDLLDVKVHDERDIKKLRIPYIGDIPLVTSKKNLFVSEGDNSNVAEAFRFIRTNINFMLDRKDVGKTVFITSTLSKEGKTFTAINLASSLAISGKKTLLIAMDVRAPKINKYLDLEEMLGVTNYIKNNGLAVEDIIGSNSKLENLHIINSGDIPPNPVELLMSNRVQEIFDYAKDNYEYIIVDTAPVGMVTDTIQISNYADLTIYVVKANFIDKRMLHIPKKLHKEQKLHNMAILINGSDYTKGAYGYGYGYGNKKKKPWYKKII